MRIKLIVLTSFIAVMLFAPTAFALADCYTDQDTCLAKAACQPASSTDQSVKDCRKACADVFLVCLNPPAVPDAPTSGGLVSTAAVTLTNPLGTTDPRVIIGNLIKAVFTIIGSVTLLMFIYGGVLWATSMGNEKMVTKGKQVLIWTTIGLAVIAGAYTLTNAVITGLTTGSMT